MPEIGDDSGKLRELARWYREFAERAGNPTIWEGRLRTAEDLEAEANVIDRARAVRHKPHAASRVVGDSLCQTTRAGCDLGARSASRSAT